MFTIYPDKTDIKRGRKANEIVRSKILTKKTLVVPFISNTSHCPQQLKMSLCTK